MSLRALVCAAALATLAAAGVKAAVTPDRTISTTLPVRDLALTGRAVAYVADAPQETLRCARTGLWNTATNRRFVFDAREQCRELASTGQGVWDVAVATKRVLWITYAGGNFREWTLWTASTTRRTPRQLRFVARDVDAPAPVVIGPGTAEGVPYAVDSQIVYLGDNGRAIFRTTVDSPVRQIAAGHGGRLRVLALLADGTIVGFDEQGENFLGIDVQPPGSVAALRVGGRGPAFQVRSIVDLGRVGVRIPAGATMVDVAQGRILWTRTGDLGATSIATGASTRLVDGTKASPALGQLEQRGFAWARGKLVRWNSGRLP